MPRRPKEPIKVRVVQVEAGEAEVKRVWAEVGRILAKVAAEPPEGA